MMIVTSETDQATKKAFPAGRFFSNLFESTQSDEQRKTVMHTVGHLGRYKTHDIKLASDSEKFNEEEKIDSGKCGCPYLQPTHLFWEKFNKTGSDGNKYVDKMIQALIKEIDESEGSKKNLCKFGKDTIQYGNVKMTRNLEKKYSTNHPYLVIQTDKNLIRNHNEIYGDDFTNFVRWFYIRHIKYKLAFPVDRCE